jgi:hypothetical protein
MISGRLCGGRQCRAAHSHSVPKEDKEEAVLDNIDCGDLDHYCSI